MLFNLLGFDFIKISHYECSAIYIFVQCYVSVFTQIHVCSCRSFFFHCCIVIHCGIIPKWTYPFPQSMGNWLMSSIFAISNITMNAFYICLLTYTDKRFSRAISARGEIMGEMVCISSN